MKKFLKITGIVVVSLLVITIVVSMATGIKPLALNMHDPLLKSNGTALKGYDAVSYFKGAPTKGDKSLGVEHQGALWLFSSPENLEAFKENPSAYTPQYGGYCTFAVGTGFSAPGEPTHYLVHDNKLYIFSNEDVLKEFSKDPQASIASCNKHWK
jgi:YHS domain-containing protein